MSDLQVRRRKPVYNQGYLNQNTTDDDEIKSRKSTKIDQNFTNLIFVVCAVIFLFGGIILMFPESFIMAYSLKAMDWSFLKLGISSKLHAVVLGKIWIVVIVNVFSLLQQILAVLPCYFLYFITPIIIFIISLPHKNQSIGENS